MRDLHAVIPFALALAFKVGGGGIIATAIAALGVTLWVESTGWRTPSLAEALLLLAAGAVGLSGLADEQVAAAVSGPVVAVEVVRP